MYLLSEIAKEIDGELCGDDKEISSISEINNGSSSCLSFIDNPLYLKYYSSTNCGALIVSVNFKENDRENISLIKVNSPRLGLLKAIKLIYKDNDSRLDSEDDFKKTCAIDQTAIIGENLDIGTFVHISHNSIIGNNVCLGDHCIIGENVSIGDNVKLHNNVTIEKDCIIKDNSIIQSGTVIGSNGFGTVKDQDKHLNFPHIGKVVIGEDVWIGSNVSVDRGTIGDTLIGDNTKIDNLVQIGHNVKIGQSCILVSGVAIAGTATIGNNVSIGGQVGIVGHITIGDNCLIGAKSLVTKSFSDNLFISGNPAKIHKDRVREEVALRDLPQYMKKIKKL